MATSAGEVSLKVGLDKSGLPQEVAQLQQTIGGIKDIQIPVGFTIDKQGRLRDEIGRYVKGGLAGLGKSGEGVDIPTQFVVADDSLTRLKAEVANAKASLAKDSGAAAGFARESQLLQESLRSKQQLAGIKGAGFSPEDTAQAEKFAATINQLNLGRIEQEFQRSTVASSGFFGGVNRFVESTQKAAIFAQGVAVVGQQLQQAAAQVNRFGDQSVEAFKQRDQAIGSLKTLGPSTDIEGLKKGFQDLAKEQGSTFSQTQLLNAGYNVLSAGFTKTADALNVSKNAALLAKGGFTDLETAGDGLTSSLKAYSKGSEEAGRFADILTATQNAGKIKVGEFVGEIGRIAPTAAAAGIPLEQIGATLATLTNNGVKSSEAVTATSAAIAAFVNPSNDAQQIAKTLGIELGESAIKAKGFPAVLQSIVDKGDLSLTTLTKLANGNVEAGKALVPLLQNLGDYKKNLDAVTNSQGAAAAAAKIVNAEFGEKLSQAANKANDAFASAGTGIGKALIPLIDGAVLLLDKFNALPDPIKEFAGVAVGATGGILSLGAGALGVAATLPILKAGFDVLSGSIGRTTVASEVNTIANAANAESLIGDTVATEANATAKNTAGTAALGLAGKLGTLAVQGGLTAIAIGAVTEAAGRFADGGKVFNDIADQGKKRLLDLQIEADKTKEKLDGIKPKSTLPEEPPPTGIIDSGVDAFNKAPGFVKTGARVAAQFASPFGGFLPNNLTTDAEKKVNDARLGVGNLTDVSGQVVDQARGVTKATPVAQAVKVQEAVKGQLDDTNKALQSLDPSKLGTKAYEELKTKLEASKKELENTKVAIDKVAGSSDSAASATGKLGDAAIGTGEKIAKASLRLKELQAQDQLQDATFGNKKQDAVTSIKRTQKTFGVDEDRAIQQQTNQAEITANNAQIAATEKSLAEVQELKKAGGAAAIEATQQEAQLITKLSGLRSSAAEKEVSQRRIANQKILTDADLANKKQEAGINQRANTFRQNNAGGTVETSKLDEQVANETIALKQRELAETQKLKQQGVLGAREAAEKELAIEQALDGERTKLVQVRRARELDEFERRTKLANSAIDRGASAATLSVRQTQLTTGKPVGEGGQSAISQIEEQATQQRLAQGQKELAGVNRLEQRKVLGVKESEDRKLAILQKADGDRAKLLDLQTQRELRAIQNAADAYKRQGEAAVNSLDLQKTGNDLVSDSIGRQVKLVEAQASLSASVAEARQQQLKAAVDRAGEAVDSFKKLQDKKLGANQRDVITQQVGQLSGGVANGSNPADLIALIQRKQAAESEADREKLAALKEQQNFERQTEQLKLKQAEISARNNILEAQRANVTAKIVENEKQANLLKAQKTGDQNEIANAQQDLSLARQNVAITGAQIGNQQENAAVQQQVGQTSQQALGIRQNTALQAQQEQNLTAGRGRARELAESADSVGVKLAIDPNGLSTGIGGGVSYNSGQTLNAGQTSNGAPVTVPQSPGEAANGKGGAPKEDVGTKLDQIKALLEKNLNKPNIGSLQVSTATPVADSAKIAADLSSNQVGEAGL